MDPLLAVGQLDSQVLQAIQAGTNPVLTAVMLAITFLGSPIFWVGIASAIYWRGQENRSFFLMNLIIFVSAAAGALKCAFVRPRPSSGKFSVLGSDDYGLHSFPSGHAAIIAGVFSYAYNRIKGHWKILFIAAVLLVAYSRLYLGMHFPSDVLAGIALGLIIGKLNLIARNRLFHRNFKPSKLEDELALVGLIAVAVIAILFLRSLPMAGLFIGFYAGFFLFKEMGLSQSILMRKPLLAKYAVGFAFLIGLVLIGEGIVQFGIAITKLQQFGLYLLGGFWISWLWPMLFEKAFAAGPFPKAFSRRKKA